MRRVSSPVTMQPMSPIRVERALLETIALRQRARQNTGAHGLYAQAAHDSQRHDANKHDVAAERSTGERVTFKTVALVVYSAAMHTEVRDAMTAPAAVAATAAPVSESQRIAALDMLRGVAVLGILLMNIWVFGVNLRGDGISEIYSRPGSADFWSFALITILFEGKMRALFCMLFGAGILLFTTNKEAAGKRTITRLFYVRMFWLVILGLINAHVLLWEGDILYFYGLFGMLVYLLRRMRPAWKATGVPIVAIIGFVLTTTFLYGIRTQRLAYVEALATADSGRTLSPEQNSALASWREIEVTFIPNAEDRAKEIEAMRGSYGEVAAIVHKHALELETTLLPTQLGDNIALMLLGMALLQVGFFAARWSTRAYGFTMAIGTVSACRS